MGETPDQLRQEVDQTRESAAQKIDQIEARIEETTQRVKDTVEQTTQKVKDSFDVRRQIEEKPILALGVGFVGGFVLGGLLGGGDDEDRGRRDWREQARSGERFQAATSYQGRTGGGVVETIRNAAKQSGLEDTLNELAAAVMGTLTDRVKAVADQAFPGVAERLQSGQQDGRRLQGPRGISSTSVPPAPELDAPSPGGASF